MRFLGGIMILGGCLGLGLWYRDQILGRTKALRNLTMILELLMSEIRYGKSTLPECCRSLTGRVGEPYKKCLDDICRRVREEKGLSFSEVFCGRMRECLKEQPLREGDVAAFLRPFSEGGFQDGEMQLRSIEQGIEQIGHEIARAEKEQTEKCRMAVGLGAMCGLLLLIILI